MSAESPLCARLVKERRALLIDRTLQLADDLPASAELEEWRRRTAAQIVAPLLVGNEFLGVVGLDRERHEDRFSFEDLDLMTNMAAQVATVLRSVQLGKELATAREVELLSQWSRMILHDLKNYLSPLRLIVQNMRVYMGNPEFQRDAVEDLASVATRMESLIKRLSDLRQGKLWAGEVVDLNEVVKETLDRLKLELRRSLVVETDLNAEVRVHGDTIMLQSVVENLVTNAVDAMEGKGRLVVRTLTVSHPGGEVPGFLLEVSDDGPGIRPEFQRDRLFRPFSTTKRGGWGLGLYQVRSIVEAHQGEITYDSRPGHGTVFRVHLPGTRDRAPHPDFKIAASIPEAGRRGPWGR
jgi:putative PEP-CTERM system histidine kinase